MIYSFEGTSIYLGLLYSIFTLVDIYNPRIYILSRFVKISPSMPRVNLGHVSAHYWTQKFRGVTSMHRLRHSPYQDGSESRSRSRLEVQPNVFASC